jgi:hypothetical protein
MGKDGDATGGYGGCEAGKSCHAGRRFALDRKGKTVMIEEATLTLFTFCNSIRIFGYLPQLLRSARDESGGSSTSITTWALFFAANTSTAAYALVNANDPLMALMFSLNALCCVFITVVTLWKRRLFSSASRKQRRAIAERARQRRPLGAESPALLQSHRMSADGGGARWQRHEIGAGPSAMHAAPTAFRDRLAIPPEHLAIEAHDGKRGLGAAVGNAKNDTR